MTEKEQLSTLNKNEKNFLARKICAWCEMPLNLTGCSAIYEQCCEGTRIKRRIDCLKTYNK